MNDAQGAHAVTFDNVYDAAYGQQYPRTFAGLGYAARGDNDLRFRVNNTDQALTGPAIAHYSPGYLDIDPSALYTSGCITFDPAATGVPEPAKRLLVALGLLSIAAMQPTAARAGGRALASNAHRARKRKSRRISPAALNSCGRCRPFLLA